MTTATLNRVRGADLPALAFESPSGFDPKRVRSIRNAGKQKPAGGVWLSRLDDSGTTGWRRYIEQEQWGVRKGFQVDRLQLHEDASVVVVDSREDFDALHDAYPAVGRRFPSTIMLSMGPDFESMSRDHDAVWLTAAGVEACRYAAVPGGFHFYSWDIESVLVLRPERLVRA